jgi:hypothetical protein
MKLKPVLKEEAGERKGFLGRGALLSCLSERPITKRDALSEALKSLGVEAIITDEIEGSRGSFFEVVSCGKRRMLSLADSVMESDDPVSEALKVVKEMGIGR